MHQRLLCRMNINVPVAPGNTIFKPRLARIILSRHHIVANHFPGLTHPEHRSLLHQIAVFKARHISFQKADQTTNGCASLTDRHRSVQRMLVIHQMHQMRTIEGQYARLPRHRIVLEIAKIIPDQHTVMNRLIKYRLQRKTTVTNHGRLKIVACLMMHTVSIMQRKNIGTILLNIYAAHFKAQRRDLIVPVLIAPPAGNPGKPKQNRIAAGIHKLLTKHRAKTVRNCNHKTLDMILIHQHIRNRRIIQQVTARVP